MELDILAEVDVVDHEKFDTEAKLEEAEKTFSLRGRRLEGAVLTGAHLRKVDFTSAQLDNADLSGADLRGAKFGCATVEHKEMRQSSEEGYFPLPVPTVCSQLRGASFIKARLQNAILDLTDLRNSDFKNADLRGASLHFAQLDGAFMLNAMLQGASLDEASLRGANLSQANLSGASLVGTKLVGAALPRATLRGADLSAANLMAADLKDSRLQGAFFRCSELQGAMLAGAQLQSTKFWRAGTWRADVSQAKGKPEFVVSTKSGPQVHADYRSCKDLSDWTATDYDDLLKWSLTFYELQDVLLLDQFQHRIAILDPRASVAEDGYQSWTDLAKSSASSADEDFVAISLKVACDLDGAPYVVHRLIGVIEQNSNGPDKTLFRIAATLLDKAQCVASRLLSSDDEMRLLNVQAQTRERPMQSSSNASSE